MTDEIFDQIMAIRADASVNLFDTVAVQRLAYANEFYAMLLFIEEHKREYAEFIMHGTRAAEESEGSDE